MTIGMTMGINMAAYTEIAKLVYLIKGLAIAPLVMHVPRGANWSLTMLAFAFSPLYNKLLDSPWRCYQLLRSLGGDSKGLTDLSVAKALEL